MADAAAFDFVCTQLERRTSLERLEARGTVRLALKDAGLESHLVSSHQMAVLLEKVLPGELIARGIRDGETVCAEIARGLLDVKVDGGASTPETVFERLGR